MPLSAIYMKLQAAQAMVQIVITEFLSKQDEFLKAVFKQLQ